MSLARRFGIMIVPLLLLSVSAMAQEPETEESVAEQLKSLRKEMEGLRQVNEVMMGEIDELRAKTQDNWLTEHRAEEIRILVQDVLADADTRSSLLQDGLIAGWRDHFFIASPDGRFKLQFGGMIQTRWVLSYHDQRDFAGAADGSGFDAYRHGFENTRSKLIFQGHVFSPDIEYMLQTSFRRFGVGVAVLEDSWVRFHLNSDVSIRVGQFKLPFNREELVSSTRQLAVERSLINERMNIGRSQGIEITFTDETTRFSLAFNDGGFEPNGIFNVQLSDPANKQALIEDVEYAVTARFEQLLAGEWNQFKDFTSPQGEPFGMMWGLGVHFQEDESNGRATGSFRDETRWMANTIDLSIEWGGANAFISFTHFYFDPTGFNTSMLGLVVQGGLYLVPKWEVYTRFEYGSIQHDVVAGLFSDLNVLTIGANYYIDGHDVKWTTDLGVGISKIDVLWNSDITGFRPEADNAEPQFVFRSQLQLLF